MNRIFAALCRGAIGLSVLAAATSARAELAAYGLDPNGNGTYLLYVEGDQVFRMECERGSSIHDHAHCKDHPARAPATAFFAKLPGKFATYLPYFDNEAQEAYVKISQIDVRLFQLVNTQTPQTSTPVTDAQVAAAKRKVEDAALACTELRDQIGRLEAELSEGHGHEGDEADLEQLTADRARLLTLEKAQNVAEVELLALRQLYVEQRSDVSDQNLRDLVAMRSQQVLAYNNAKAAGAVELKDLDCAALLAARIQESGFVWETLCSIGSTMPQGGPANQRIAAAFSEADLAARSYTGSVVGLRRVTVDVPASGLVSGVRCDYPMASASANFQGVLGIEGPNGLLIESPLNNFGAHILIGWGEGFDRGADASIEAAHLSSKDGKGRWTFTFIPHFIGGPDGSATLPLVCAVTLRNPLQH